MADGDGDGDEDDVVVSFLHENTMIITSAANPNLINCLFIFN
jgi:hypothetical protein